MKRSIRWNVLWLSVISACNVGGVLAGPTTSTFVSAAWYTGWHATDFPLTNVSWSKYSHMKYAFATTSPSPNLLNLDPSDETELPKFVAQAHQYGVKATLAIGGWTGSRWFSSNVGSPRNRTMFVTSVSNLIRTYGLDGIDFDWEFPGSAGIGCNVFSPNDTDNYLAFLQEFRQSPIGSNASISLAVYVKPYPNSSGGTANMTAFSQVIDYVEIMDYDIQSTPSVGAGSSSPLNDTCAPPAAQLGSAVSAVQAWTDAGMPLDKIVLGVAAYGHSFTVPRSDAINNTSGALIIYPQYDPTQHRKGDQWDNGWGVDVCGNEQGPSGTFTYWGLIDNNILNDNGTAHEGIAYVYDNCSQTPSAYDPQAQTLISYEDPTSFAAKGRYISASGLKGFSMWEAGGDYHDGLLDAMLSGLQAKSTGASTGNSKTTSRGAQVPASTSALLGFGVVFLNLVVSQKYIL